MTMTSERNTASRPTAGGNTAPPDTTQAELDEPVYRPGDDPLQRRLVTIALALAAALIAATQVGCGGGPLDEPDEPRSAIPAAPPASQAI